MKIIAYKPGHDGHVAHLDGNRLVFSLEAEKDNWGRYETITPSLYLKAMRYVTSFPDVVAISGWVKGFHSISEPVEGGYFGEGTDTIVDRPEMMFGRTVRFFSSSHERSHLLGAYGMSPFPQGEPCYALVWEGNIGAFYRIDENLVIEKLSDVLEDPGNKYAFLYALADPSFPIQRGHFRFEDAGKLMALAGFGASGVSSPEERELIEIIMAQRSILLSLDKGQLCSSRYFDIGVETKAFKNLARRFSEALFERFESYARKHMKEGLPLLISGGCGLNCDWNSGWKQSGLFEDVFVPPCTNDSGSAIGTAVDALHYYTGQAKIEWDAYAGEEFVMDAADLSGLHSRQLDYAEVAQFLASGHVIAWVQGRYEIGPRALGNRSLLAMPFTQEVHARLNRIKAREGFRPIAPICLEEDIDRYFDGHGPSPHMLYFQRVKTDALPAVTHVDGSARLQSVNERQNPRAYQLLRAFKKETGYGVLCNTSLNFKGAGFINRLSDLAEYARAHALDGFVVGDVFHSFEPRAERNAARSSAELSRVETVA